MATPQSARACPSHNSDIAFPDRLIAEAKCRARPVLPLVNLTRGEYKASRPGRPDTARNAACIGAARQAGPLSALEILPYSRPPWPARDSLLGRAVERVPQLPTPPGHGGVPRLNGGNAKWSRYCPAGLRRFRESHGAAGSRRDLLRKAQLDKLHDLVTPSTIAAQLRHPHRRGHTTPASRPTGSSSASAMGAARR